MNFGNGNIGWVNLPGGSTPGAPTGANEGLTLIGGNVQLGVNIPDITKAITVPREIQTNGGTLAICNVTGSGAGNVFFYDETNGVHIDGSNLGPPGERTRYNFGYLGLEVHASATVLGQRIVFNNGFPTGTKNAAFGVDGSRAYVETVLQNIDFSALSGATVTTVGDVGLGYGVNVGFDLVTNTSGIIYQDATSQPIVFQGISIDVTGDSWALYMPFCPNPFPLTISYLDGLIYFGGSDTNGSGLINIATDAVTNKPQFNFKANAATFSTSGDFNYDGSDFGVRIGTTNKTILAGRVIVGAVSVDATRYVEISIGGVVYKLLIST